MFYEAPAFNYDLCAWGSIMKSRSDVRKMFFGTSCPRTDWIRYSTPEGPFCYDCTREDSTTVTPGKICFNDMPGGMTDSGCEGDAPLCDAEEGEGGDTCISCINDKLLVETDSGCLDDEPICVRGDNTEAAYPNGVGVECKKCVNDKTGGATDSGCYSSAPLCEAAVFGEGGDSCSSVPSSSPSETPSVSPNAVPSTAPSGRPSSSPSDAPADAPSTTPSSQPSVSPSVEPSVGPSASPSSEPSSTIPAEPTTEAAEAQPSTADTTSVLPAPFSNKAELKNNVLEFLENRIAWAESDCNGGERCGNYYGYANLLT
jgi:hypothetical protein